MTDGILPLDPDAVAELADATAVGGVVLFPAEGVYGLAADPRHPEAVRRIARLKGRDPDKPSSVLFWSLDAAVAALGREPVDGVGDGAVPGEGPVAGAGVGDAVLRALERLLPGPVGVVVPNPARRFSIATGPDVAALGVRVPALAGGPVDAPPVVQTSANRAGEPDPATVDAVPRAIRRACDLVLDRGVRPGVPSTVVDLRGLAEPDGGWRLLRVGAVPADEVERALEGLGRRRA